MRKIILQKLIFWPIICLFLIFPAMHAHGEDSQKEQEALFVAKKAFEDGFYEVSLGLLERFLKNYPNSEKKGEASLLIGQCYFQQNKFLDALEQFEDLANQSYVRGIQDAVYYWTGEVHFRGNNFDKAKLFYQKVIDGFPGSSYLAPSYYSIGWCYFQEADFIEALKFFRQVEEKYPKDPLAKESAFKIIECYYNNKDYSSTKEAVKTYLKKYPLDADRQVYLFFYTAEADYYLNNYNDAIGEYGKVLNKTKDKKIAALSKLGIGWAYLKLKHAKEAQNVFGEIDIQQLEGASRDTLLLGKAIIMFDDKQFGQARALYDELLRTTTDGLVLIQAYLGKADTFYSQAEFKEASSVYQEALGKVSDSVPADLVDKIHYGLAWSYLKEGSFKEAIDQFQKVAKQSEDKTIKVSALCQIGDAYQDSGNFTKAIEIYDTILKDYPDSLYTDYVQYQLGSSLLKTNNYDGAILAFQSLKINYPNSKLLDDASYALGLSYFQRENYEAAKEALEKFLTEFKDSSLRGQATYLLGTSLYNLQRFPEAIDVYKNIIRTYGQDQELVQKCEYEIADCYYQMGNEKEAMNRFNMLRTKYPDSELAPEIVWWLGEYYYRHNDPALARRYFSSLIQDFPKSSLVPHAYYALGSTYQEESQYQEAISNFEKVIEFNKTDLAAQAAIAIADIYLKQDKIESALTSYKKVVEEFNNLADLIYPKIGDIYRQALNFDEALTYYRKSLDIVPVKEMGGIQFRIADVLQAQGKTDEAILEYLKVSYLYTEDTGLLVKSLLRVAAIYEDKQDYHEAVNIYKRISGMDVEEAKYAKERIEEILKQKPRN